MFLCKDKSSCLPLTSHSQFRPSVAAMYSFALANLRLAMQPMRAGASTPELPFLRLRRAPQRL